MKNAKKNIGDSEYFYITDGDGLGSRVGGNPPNIEFLDDNFLSEYFYFLTISGNDVNISNGNDLSIFIGNDFAVYNEKTNYPEIKIKCFIHSPAEISKKYLGKNDTIKSANLIKKSPITAGDSYLVKWGGDPDLIQKEPSYSETLIIDGYRFLFQVDDNGFPDGFLSEDYLFGYGALYIYGKINDDGAVIEAVPGFTQF